MLLIALPGLVLTEPYMSVREGYKCSKCHVNKTGGGKRTDYAQVYMQTRMAMNPVVQKPPDGKAEGAEEKMFSGRVNEFFSVGADLRTSYNIVSPFQGKDEHQFNRPSACASCHAATNGGGKLAEIYFQLEPMPGKVSIVASQNLKPTVASRELYALAEGLPANGYAKAGDFRLPTALQNTFDDPFAHGVGRTRLGFNGVAGVETVRGSGVEVGIEPGPFSFVLSLTSPADTSAVTRDTRLAFMAYVVGSIGLAGVNFVDDPIAESVSRETVSAFGGSRWGRFTGLLQLDRMVTTDDASATELERQAGLAELDFLAAKGTNIKLLYEFMDPDENTGGDVMDRISIIYEPFFTPYFQLRAGYRDYTGPAGDADSNFNKYFAEIHVLF